MGHAHHFGAGIGDGDGESGATHENGVGEIVADEANLLGAKPGIGQDFIEQGQLLGVAHVAVLHVAGAGALGGGF